MATKNEIVEVVLKIKGQRDVAEGTGVAKKGIEGVGKASKKTSAESAKAHKANSVLTKSYSKLGQAARYGLGFIGVGGVFALEQAVMNTEELSKTTTGLNRNLGLSVKVGSQWAAVAYSRGIASTALNMGMTKLSKSFVEANRKGGTARTGLNQLGITQAQTAKGAHDFSYALDLVAQKFGEAEAGPRRQTAAMSLLGKGYSTLLPLFSQGSKGLQEQLGWAEKYGVALDGKTNDAVGEMIAKQRESKVAMLGLQVAMTTALMPAIDAGDDQLQKFISTLNSNKLSGTEKLTAIEKQFEHLEDFLLQAIGDALPKIAEQGGQLGIKLAAAVWTGFKNSDLLGKAVIATYLFKTLGGGTYLTNMLKSRYGTLGKGSGKAFTAGVLLGSVGLGYLLAEEIDRKSGGAFRQWGINAGQNFTNALISVVNFGIGNINSAMDDANALAILGVEAPNIGEVGPVNFHAPKSPNSPINGLPEVPPTFPHLPVPGKTRHKHPKPVRRADGRPGRPNDLANWGGRAAHPQPTQIVHHQPIQLVVDGKVLAEVVARHAQRAQSRS